MIHNKSLRILSLFAAIMLPVFIGLFIMQISYAAEEQPALIADTTITVTTAVDDLTNNGNCSLREAVQAANTDTAADACPAGSGWDTITLPAGIYQLTLTGADEDANATGDLDILESVTILGAGPGSTTIDGMAADRVLHVDPTETGVSLDLQDVAITNGSSENGGGLRANNGLTTLQNTVFEQNEASNSGGAIHIDYGTLHVLTSTIQHNNVMSSETSLGGGIFIYTATATIDNSTIYTNTAGDGGGIYNSTGSLSVRNSQVISNATVTSDEDQDGGGIYVSNGALIVEDGSEVAYNFANNDGGGIYVYDNAASIIEDSWIHHNFSNDDGGGIATDNYTTLLRNNTIEYNESASSGGGIFAGNDTVLDSNTIAHNTADYGGGIYHAYYSLSITNTTFFSNTALSEGGGIYHEDDGGVVMRNSVLRENHANYGGGLYVYYESGAVIEHTLFVDNSADEDGGAIYGEGAVTFNIDRSTFTGNTANYGGAFYFYSDVPADIRNSTIAENYAEFEGGAFYIESDLDVGLEYSTIVSNTAGATGGAIYTEYAFVPQNSIIAGNNAGDGVTDDCHIEEKLYSGGNNLFGDGGGCEATRYDQTVAPGTLFTTVLEPLTDNGGAALPGNETLQTYALKSVSPAIDAGDDTFCPLVDERGVARPQGNGCDVGAYESDYSASVPTPTENIITVDTKVDDVVTNSNCTLREAILAANTDTAVDGCAAGDGWDVISLSANTYAKSITDTINITNSLTIRGVGADDTIINGLSDGQVLNAYEATLRIEETAVMNGQNSGSSSSNYGGCINITYGLALIENSLLSNCIETGTNANGGGLYNYEGVVRFANSTIENSAASNDGGGFSNRYAVTSIQNSTVYSNTAADDGGGIYGYVTAVRISNSDLLSNTATGEGGGFTGDYGSLIVNEGTQFKYNRDVDYGAAITIDEMAVAIDDAVISHNVSTEGSVTYLGYGSWMRNTLFEENESAEDGAGYIAGWSQNITIRNNTAISTTHGGTNLEGVIENILVEDNDAPFGGGLYINHSAIINNGVIRNNSASELGGGGIYVETDSAVIILDSTIADNTVDPGQNGAGIYAESPVMIRRSTISGNYGGQQGGGIYNDAQVVDLVNSTISGNRAIDGGGIYVLTGTVSLDFSTVADNTATGQGGGVYNAKATTLESSIVAGNNVGADREHASANCYAAAPFTFAGYSVFGEETGCEGNGRYDQTSDPTTTFTTLLESLTDNGGNTETHALTNSSIAFEAGNPDYCPATDQRGVSRPRFNGCDSGAYETEFAYVFLPIILK